MAFRAIRPDRLTGFLFAAQPADQRRAGQKGDDHRCHDGATRAEALVFEQIEKRELI